MNKNPIRIIPILDIKNGLLIKGVNLEGLRILGKAENFSNHYFLNLDFSSDNTSKILDTSIVTQYESWNQKTEVKLINILKRFKQDNNVGSK